MKTRLNVKTLWSFTLLKKSFEKLLLSQLTYDWQLFKISCECVRIGDLFPSVWNPNQTLQIRTLVELFCCDLRHNTGPLSLQGPIFGKPFSADQGFNSNPGFYISLFKGHFRLVFPDKWNKQNLLLSFQCWNQISYLPWVTLTQPCRANPAKGHRWYSHA